MDIALWVVQGLLALAFGLAGVMKTTQPIDKLAASLKWPGDIQPWLVRFIGAAELLGAIGLIAPAWRWPSGSRSGVRPSCWGPLA